jgi:hypothetical protein
VGCSRFLLVLMQQEQQREVALLFQPLAWRLLALVQPFWKLGPAHARLALLLLSLYQI